MHDLLEIGIGASAGICIGIIIIMVLWIRDRRRITKSSVPLPNKLDHTIWIPCVVLDVIDGDSLVCDIYFPLGITVSGKRVRAMDYDAWEASKVRKSVTVTDAEVNKGKLAKLALEELIHSANVQLGFQPGADEFDGRGRVLAKFAVMDADGTRVPIDAWMCSRGHVRH